MRLVLASSLLRLIPGEARSARPHLDIAIDAADGVDFASQIRERFPSIGSLVLTEDCRISAGFVLVINNEVSRTPLPNLKFSTNDELYLFAAIAGGC